MADQRSMILTLLSREASAIAGQALALAQQHSPWHDVVAAAVMWSWAQQQRQQRLLSWWWWWQRMGRLPAAR